MFVLLRGLRVAGESLSSRPQSAMHGRVGSVQASCAAVGLKGRSPLATPCPCACCLAAGWLRLPKHQLVRKPPQCGHPCHDCRPAGCLCAPHPAQLGRLSQHWAGGAIADFHTAEVLPLCTFRVQIATRPSFLLRDSYLSTPSSLPCPASCNHPSELRPMPLPHRLWLHTAAAFSCTLNHDHRRRDATVAPLQGQ